MFSNVNKKRVVGHLVDFCDDCGEKQTLVKFRKQYLCPSCLKVYKRTLASPRDVRDEQRQRTRFHKLVDGATDNAHTAPFNSDN